MITRNHQFVVFCSNSAVISESETEDEEKEDTDDEFDDGLNSPAIMGSGAPPVRRRRSRYRKLYPGEKKGITEEMRFVAMKLRNSGKPKKTKNGGKSSGSDEEPKNEALDSGDDESDKSASEEEAEVDNVGGNGNGETWQPSMEGFLKYLVDSKLVFSTIERIVDESSDVSCKCTFSSLWQKNYYFLFIYFYFLRLEIDFIFYLMLDVYFQTDFSGYI